MAFAFTRELSVLRGVAAPRPRSTRWDIRQQAKHSNPYKASQTKPLQQLCAVLTVSFVSVLCFSGAVAGTVCETEHRISSF